MQLLLELIKAHGPSGNEKEVRDIIQREIKKYIPEVWIDKFGNLLAHQKGKGPKIMLAAHMDEVGLMAKKIKKNGQIEFAAIGGIESTALVGQAVHIMAKNGLVKGVVTHLDVHEAYPLEKLPELKDLYVDTGLDKKQVETLGIEVGSYILPVHMPGFLGSKKILSGKALDNRIGCYILLELAKRLKKFKANVFYVFTVQEEIGLYGAQTSVYNLDPDWGIAVDTTNSEDGGEEAEIRLGMGPHITIMDVEMISNMKINEAIKKVAKKYKLPVNYLVEEAGTTDASKISMAKGGIPSTVVGVPVRNIHTTISIANTDDIDTTIELLYELIKNPPTL